jgi:GH24 family phage-related lysozyme (muramidase)
MNYTIDEHGTEFLTAGEGFRAQVYDDKDGTIISSYAESVGTPTIGYGLALQTAELREKYKKYLGGGKTLSKSKGLALFKDTVQKYMDGVNEKLTAPITQSMMNSLTSYAYNVGVNSSFLKRAIEALNQGDYVGASQVIRSGPYTGAGIGYMAGLEKRRNKEADLFLDDGLPSLFNQAMKQGFLTPVLERPVFKYTLYASVLLLIGAGAYKIKQHYYV